MSQPVKTPAINTRYAPAAEYCRLTRKEEHYLDDHSPSCLHFKRGARPRCVNVVNVGLFFDGTNNNMKRDYDDKPPATRCHSNVVRLYLAYPDKRSLGSANQYFPYYIPGVGTPFPEIGETTETQAGKAFAKGGQARILWAVLQVYNAVHRAVYDNEPLFSNDEMAGLIKDYEHKVDDQRRPDPEAPPILRRDWFRPLTERLSQKLRERLARRLPEIPLVSLSVFGFSRGAVEARAFCCWYQDALQDGLFAGSETEIKFLGVFDSVASVGTSASMHEQFGLWMLSGHSSWAAEILKPLPAIVKKTVHLMAAHEVRMNFPLTRVLRSRADPNAFIYDSKVALSPRERGGASQMQVVYADAGYPLTPWEHWALGIFDAPLEKRRETDVTEDAFFENFVHDSLAGFYLAGAVTRHDQALEFNRMCAAKAGGGRLNPFQQRLYAKNKLAADSRIRGIQSGQNVANDGELALQFPIMRDDDAPAMRVAIVRLATSSRREGGGYFRQRWVYMPEASGLKNATDGLAPRRTA
ncbi:phospholipase effector Tle1 domain-containing protein [Cupriavidus campinensis]